MEGLKQLLFDITDSMSIAGFEYHTADKLRGALMKYFDESHHTPNGNIMFIKRSEKPNAPRLLIDAHYDEIGMMVTEIKENGFIRVTNIGGIDTRILLAGEVIIYGSEPVYGVVCVMPPHLQKPGESNTLPQIGDLLIDTGLSSEDLVQKGVETGTPVGFKPGNLELLNNCVAGKGYDNKSSVAAAAEIMRLIDGADVGWDICLLCSCKEEVSALGAKIGSYDIDPDAAIVLDVNLAYVPDTARHKTVKVGGGPSVSISAVTDRGLTRAVISFANDKNLRHQTIVEAVDTGSDANHIPLTRGGIPTVLIGIPLKNMHTYSEVISLDDVSDTAKLVAGFIKGGLSKWMNG
jgi:putative aminopeptidase FrvX